MLLPMLVYILLMQLRPIQDIAYVAMAARTAVGGAAAAQGMVALSLAFAEITGNMSSGFVADNFGWTWVPVAMVILCGLGLMIGLAGRKTRDRLYAEIGIDWKTGAKLSATVPDIRMPPKKLMESESE